MKPSAPPEILDRYAALLTDLGKRHGISNIRHGGPGKIVADVEQGRTYFDLARFEMEVRALIGHDVAVVSSDASSAGELAGAVVGGPHAACVEEVLSSVAARTGGRVGLERAAQDLEEARSQHP